MKFHYALIVVLCGLLMSKPAVGFFDDIEALERELDAVEESGEKDEDLENLIKQLESVNEGSEAVSFNDVQSSDWFHQYVSGVAARGIVTGYRDAHGNRTGQFGPGDPVRISEILKIAIEAAGLDTSACTHKPSTTGAVGHWAETYVACAEMHDFRIVDGGVDLNRPAKRGEVLGIIHDAFGDTVTATTSPFRDTGGHAYEADIAYAASAGIVSGDKDASGNPTGTYRPDDGVNRAEAAKIVFVKLGL